MAAIGYWSIKHKRLSTSENSMSRWQGCLLLLMIPIPALGQEWRPVSASSPTASTTAINTGISLGKPRRA
ncbi:MAG TPA: hypothetical protein PKA06_07540, partial [Gemmatales bacterium]|nr:hypothetical protein [Gemmatales bacterium]